MDAVSREIADRNKRFYERMVDHWRRIANCEAQDGWDYMRRSHQMGAHLLLSLLMNIYVAFCFVALVATLDLPVVVKIGFGLCFVALGSIALGRLVLLLRRDW